MRELDLMVFIIEGLRFEKYEKSGTVNVYINETNENIYCFTHYEIKDNYRMFKESCIETFEELMNE